MSENYKEIIEKSTETLKAYIKEQYLYRDDLTMLKLETMRYNMMYKQIHEFLAPKRTQSCENEILDIIKVIFKYDKKVCESKIDKCEKDIANYNKRKMIEKVNLSKEIKKNWERLYENFYSLIAFRSLEHFAIFMEWDKAKADKMWEYSIDTFGDNGYSGCTKGFFYYANKMILGNDIRFIMKQLPTSFGKCGHPLTKVRTPKGITTLQDLQVGDIVYSMENNTLTTNKVLNKWYSKKQQVKIKTKSGIEIIVSPEHKLYTQRGYIEAKDLTVKDYLYRLCSSINGGIRQDNDELMFASLMMFDGCCKSGLLSFTQEENDIFYEFIKLCERYKWHYRIRCKKGSKAKTVYVTYNNGEPNEILSKYGMLDCLSKNKKMPKIILDLPIEQRYKFLGYMFATDGYIPYLKVGKGGRLAGITLASKDLAQGIQYLLNSCGIYSILTERKVKFNNKSFDAYVVQIPEEYFPIIAENVYCYHKQKLVQDRMDKINSFSFKAHSNNTNYPKEIVANCKEFKRVVNKQFARNKTFKRELVESFNQKTGLLSDIVYKDFVFEQIKSIETDYTEIDMIDIEVENTHNFIANDIVSHNSYSDSEMIAFIFGYDETLQVIKVVGNKSLVSKCTKQVADIMKGKRYRQVFPKFVVDESKKDIESQIFSTCSITNGILTINDSGKDTSFECFSKETDRDGIRGDYLFLDDIVQRSERMKIREHKKDITAFRGTWKKRARDEKTFKIVCGGTTYDPYDLLMTLKFDYSGGTFIKSEINKYTTLSKDRDAVFVCVPKLDEKGQLTFPQKTVLKNVLKDKKDDYELFMAMDMQQPLAPKDTPFYWNYIHQYKYIPSNCSDYALATIDTARSGNNYVSMPIFKKVIEIDNDGQEVEKYYLVNALYQMATMDSLYVFICALIEKHHIIKLYIENNIDISLKALLDKMLSERGIKYCEITDGQSTKNKEERIYCNETLIKNTIVFPDRDMYGRESEIGVFMEHIISYKYKGAEYDDSIDSVSLFIDKFIRSDGDTSGEIEIWEL